MRAGRPPTRPARGAHSAANVAVRPMPAAGPAAACGGGRQPRRAAGSAGWGSRPQTPRRYPERVTTSGAGGEPGLPRIPGYDDFRPIGRGGFGTVWRAHQSAYDRWVAVKILDSGLTDEAARSRFQRECATTGRLTGHPNIITVLDSGFLEDGRPYLTMAYCEGGSLADRLQRSGPMPVPDVARIGVKIAGALHAAHRRDVLHRDVKPENILVTSFGEPALADFGISTLAGGAATGLTAAYTPSHAAPEVLRGQAADVRSDIYTLGSTLYQLLRGTPAFGHTGATGLAGFVTEVLTRPPPDPGRPDVPPAVRDAILAAMAKDPAARPQTAADFGRLLQQAQQAAGWPVTEMVSELVAGPGESSPSVLPRSSTTGPPPPVGTILPPSFSGSPQPMATGGEATMLGGRAHPIQTPVIPAAPPGRPAGRRVRVLVPLVVLALVAGAVGVWQLVARGSAAPVAATATSTIFVTSTEATDNGPTTSTPAASPTSTPSASTTAVTPSAPATTRPTTAKPPPGTTAPPIATPPPPPAPPAPPAEVYAAPKAMGEISVVWRESPTAGVVEYRIYRSTEGGPRSSVATIPRSDAYRCGTSYPHCFIDSPPAGLNCYQLVSVTSTGLMSSPSTPSCAARP